MIVAIEARVDDKSARNAVISKSGGSGSTGIMILSPAVIRTPNPLNKETVCTFPLGINGAQVWETGRDDIHFHLNQLLDRQALLK